MKYGKTITTALVIGAWLVALSGCQKKEDPVENSQQGTAEHAGQEIDEAAAKAGEKIEQIGEKIQDEAKGDKD
ncbi:MAG: hypothetical protein ACYCZA_01000 [Thiobacillus sp.]